jgi:predicted RNA-binding Zn-ribbon protein involved in translation (DUF1610 family)
MECTKCSESGKELVYMTIEHFDDRSGKTSLECPKCGKEEIIGYGVI